MKSLANTLLVSTAIYHVLVGFPSILSTATIRRIGRKIYRINIPENLDPRYEYALKPIGFYALFVAQMCLAAAWSSDLDFKRMALWALITLFMGRAWARWRYHVLFTQAFALSWQKSRWNVVFNSVLSLVVLIAALNL